MKKIINFWVEEELKKEFKRTLINKGLKMSSVMVGLVKGYIEENNDKPSEEELLVIKEKKIKEDKLKKEESERAIKEYMERNNLHETTKEEMDRIDKEVEQMKKNESKIDRPVL